MENDGWEVFDRSETWIKEFSLPIYTNLKPLVTFPNSMPFTAGSICSGGPTLNDFETENCITMNLKELNKAFFVASCKLKYL